MQCMGRGLDGSAYCLVSRSWTSMADITALAVASTVVHLVVTGNKWQKVAETSVLQCQ